MLAPFLKHLFFFLLPVVVASMLLTVLFLSNDNIYTIKKRTLEHQADSLQVIITGTSQALFSINPDLLNKPSINLAAPRQPIYFDCKIIQTYLPDLKNLKLVVFSLDYASLFYDTDNPNYSKYAYYYFWHFNNPSIHPWDIRKCRFIEFARPGPIKNMLGQMVRERKMHVKIETEGMLDNGFAALPTDIRTSDFPRQTAYLLKFLKEDIVNIKYFRDNARRLENLAALLHKKNIRLLFISAPVLSSVYNRFDESLVNLRVDFVRNLTQKYPNTFYHDFTRDPRFSSKDFHDPGHLHGGGAVKFSQIIRDEINKLEK